MLKYGIIFLSSVFFQLEQANVELLPATNTSRKLFDINSFVTYIITNFIMKTVFNPTYIVVNIIPESGNSLNRFSVHTGDKVCSHRRSNPLLQILVRLLRRQIAFHSSSFSHFSKNCQELVTLAILHCLNLKTVFSSNCSSTGRYTL